MTREEVVKLVDVYIAALKSGDYSSVPFSPSVSFLGPLMDAPLQGKKAVLTHLCGVSERIQDVRIKQYIIDGEEVCIIIDFETKAGTILEIVNFIKIEDGCIVYVRPFFDPRPLLT